MKKRITDYIFFIGFTLYILLGTMVSIIIIIPLAVVLLICRLYFFVGSLIDRLLKEIKEKMSARKLEKCRKSFQKEIKKRKKRAARYEKAVIELREGKRKAEENGIGTHVLEGRIMVTEEAIEENYEQIKFCEELLKRVEDEIAQLKKDKEKLLESERSKDEYPE
jgi:hypothetical protein